jgi:hypothetical protein
VRWLAALAVVAAVVAPAAAASRKVLVLPVDGALDAATRSKLTADVARLARALDGQVATGSATFTDTALAVGCDPRAPSCADEVMATLGVDELVWSTATREGGQTRLVVRRAARGAARREASTTFPAGEAGDRIASGIAPLFAPPEARPAGPRAGAPADGHGAGAPDLATEAEPGSPASAPIEPAAPPPALPPPDDHGGRTAGIALAAGGATSVVLGIALWASYASLQGQIDAHPVRTRADFDDLLALEDRANSRAIAGDAFVIAGVVAGGIGAYLWYRGHRRLAIAPAPIAHGGGVTITLIGAP